MIGDKIKKIISDKGLTQEKFGVLIGKTNACINQWIKGRRDLSTTDVEKICDVFSVSPNYLYDREDELTIPSDIVKIDVLDVSACCGNGVANISENVIGHQFISKQLLKDFTFTAPENIKIIRAVGDSMTPTINPQDMIWIDISIKEPSSDGLYLLTVGQDLMIKRIQINPFNNQVQIKSDNPAYAPIVMNDYREISCIGKVIYHMKRVG